LEESLASQLKRSAA